MMVEYYTGKRDKKGRLVKVWKAAERKGGAQTFSI